MNRRFMQLLFTFVLLFFLNACTFSLTVPDFKPKGKKLAVVAGLESEENIIVAHYMTESLRKNSRFQVVPQKQVAQALGYPKKIQGPFKTAYFQIETDYGKTDVKKIKSIQSKLGVDYVYAVWTPSETVHNGTILTLHAVGQLFEGDREVGNGKFDIMEAHTNFCLASAPTDEDKQKAIKNMSDYVAKQIAEKTGMQK